MSEGDFRALCFTYGGPAKIPLSLLPDLIGLALLDDDVAVDSTEATVTWLKTRGLFFNASR